VFLNLVKPHPNPPRKGGLKKSPLPGEIQRGLGKSIKNIKIL